MILQSEASNPKPPFCFFNPKFIFVLNPKSAMLDFLDFDYFFGKVFYLG